MERFNGISVFVEVADAGGFSAAAARLNLSRSAVGKTVSRLERRLGVRLFHRTTRTQSLTEEGQLFYESCQKALGEIRTAEDLLESGRREIRGRLRISMPVLFGRQCVAPLLRDLLRSHPVWSSISPSMTGSSIFSTRASIWPSATAPSVTAQA